MICRSWSLKALTEYLSNRPKPFDPWARNSIRLAEQSPDHGPAMAGISADLGVGTDTGAEIIGIFPGEVQRGGKGVGNITGGTKMVPDHNLIWLLDPTGDLRDLQAGECPL